MATWTMLGKPEGRSFRENLLSDPEVTQHITPSDLDAAMQSENHLVAVDDIFKKVFGRVRNFLQIRRIIRQKIMISAERHHSDISH